MSKQNYWLSFACEEFATKRTQATNGKTRGKSKQHNSSIYIFTQHPMDMKHSSWSGIKEMILWPTSTHKGINQLLSTDTLLKWVTGSRFLSWTEKEVYKELYYLLCDEEQSILEEGNKIESNEDRSKYLTEKKGSIWDKLRVINSHGISESIFPVPELSRIFWDPTNLPEFFVLFPP